MRLLLSFLITIGIFGVIAGGIYSVYEINNLKEQNKLDLQEIKDLKYENERIRRKLAKKDSQIRNNQRQKYTYNNTNTRKYTKKKIQENVKIETRYYEPKNNKTTHKKNKQYNNKIKRYQNFSDNIELISDSKITKQNDNRLESNAPIYGRYYKNNVTNIECENNEKLYKTRNECNMLLYFTDKVYLSKSNVKNVKNYNPKTHMIECDYSKEYGIMHDCKVKIYRYRG